MAKPTHDLYADLDSLKLTKNTPRPAGRGVNLKRIAAFASLASGSLGLSFLGWPYVESWLYRTPVALTEVSVVSPDQDSVRLTASGYLVAAERALVLPSVLGRVQRRLVEQGQKVEAGDVLLTLSSDGATAALRSAKSSASASLARVAVSQAELNSAIQRVAEKRRLAERARALASLGAGTAASAETLEDALRAERDAELVARNVVKAHAAEARAFAAQAAERDVELEAMSLVAPISGTVLSEPPAVGELIGPLSGVGSGPAGGLELANLDTLVVDVQVPEEKVQAVDVGSPAEVVLDAFPRERLRGTAVSMTPRVDRAKASLTVRVSLQGPLRHGYPGMAAQVSFLSSAPISDDLSAAAMTLVPADAITRRDDGSVAVFVLQGDRVRAQTVVLGPRHGGGFELTSGPAPATRIVKNPPPNLQDGQRVIATQ
ncbi:MAG: family efflux transporter subunit [Myxococcaceae bacterium]|nr:family efflux transporter subunit [Myxococcaceae bacterium]